MVVSALRRKLKFEFRTFLEKIQIFGFPWCITREDLSIEKITIKKKKKKKKITIILPTIK